GDGTAQLEPLLILSGHCLPHLLADDRTYRFAGDGSRGRALRSHWVRSWTRRPIRCAEADVPPRRRAVEPSRKAMDKVARPAGSSGGRALNDHGEGTRRVATRHPLDGAGYLTGPRLLSHPLCEC